MHINVPHNYPRYQIPETALSETCICRFVGAEKTGSCQLPDQRDKWERIESLQHRLRNLHHLPSPESTCFKPGHQMNCLTPGATLSLIVTILFHLILF